ncbi:MAG: hypothetical protein JWP29_1939 [Rhodoferax sp.]|nr:hypothetical protein [Rhodoferax sp.]
MTGAELAAPLTPPECDLRGMPYMPLDIVRLFDSDLYALSTGDEFKAALTLWGKSFLQVPAGSLPDDDRILAHLSNAGSSWRKVKAMALRGWIQCLDGRLYHPVVAEKANDAWAARLASKSRTEAARLAKADKKAADEAGKRATQSATVAHPSSVTTSVTTSVTESVTDIATRSVTTPVAQTVTGSKLSTSKVSKQESRLALVPEAVRATPKAGAPDPLGTGMADIYPDRETGKPMVNGEFLDIARRRIYDAAGLPEPDSLRELTTLIGWLAAGYVPDDMIPVIRRMASKAGDRIRLLSYFDSAIRAECRPGIILPRRTGT